MSFIQPNGPVKQVSESPLTTNDNDKTKMTSASLCNLPEELLTKIIVFTLQGADEDGISQLCILTATCGRIRRACASTASHVIWDVGARSMAAFEDAIVAVSLRHHT